MSLNSNIGIPDERARELTKKYASIIKPLYTKGKLSESESIEIIRGMDGLTDIERIWLAYHIGGINRMILSPLSDKVVINW